MLVTRYFFLLNAVFVVAVLDLIISHSHHISLMNIMELNKFGALIVVIIVRCVMEVR